jgi:hypothetical protein
MLHMRVFLTGYRYSVSQIAVLEPRMKPHRSDFATAGWAYGPAEVASALSILQAAGIGVLPHGYHHASTAWHYVTALGGVELRVPASQAEIAREILSAMPFTRTRGKVWLGFASACLLLMLAGVAVPPPPGGLYAVRPAVATGKKPGR